MGRPVPRRTASVVAVACAACAAAGLIAAGGPRLVADLVDLPADDAARALAAHGDISNTAPGLVLETRRASLNIHPVAERHFALGRALMAASRPRAGEAAEAFAAGLALAPGRGSVWAEYAAALIAAGEAGRGRAAYGMSLRRAPHDPLAVRLRAAIAP